MFVERVRTNLNVLMPNTKEHLWPSCSCVHQSKSRGQLRHLLKLSNSEANLSFKVSQLKLETIQLRNSNSLNVF